MKSLIVVPFLIGSLPLLGSVAIGYNYLKSKKDSKYLYWGGLTASAFVGWSLSTILYAKYAESVAKSVILGAEEAKMCKTCGEHEESGYCDSCDSCYGICECDDCDCYTCRDAESFEAQAPRGHKLMTAALGKKIPKMESQDALGDDAIVYAHYFNPYGIGEWWILEWDGKDEMFGYADLGYPELGYISLSELESLSIGGMELPIERDLHWQEKTLGEVKGGLKSSYGAEEIPEYEKYKGNDLIIEEDTFLKGKWTLSSWGQGSDEYGNLYERKDGTIDPPYYRPRGNYDTKEEAIKSNPTAKVLGAETYEDSWEKGVIRLALGSGCFSDGYAEWVERQIDGPSSTLNNPRYKEIISKRWGFDADGVGTITDNARREWDKSDKILDTLSDSDEFTQAEALSWLIDNGHLREEEMWGVIIELGDWLDENSDVDFDLDAESFSAESKYIKPYDKAKGFDLKRDNQGRYRRQLVIPLKKDAESTVVKPTDKKIIHSSRAFSQEHIINWMKYMRGDISKQATQLIRFDYRQCADLVDSQGYDTGATPDDCWSSYPTMQSTPEIYPLPYSPLCLRVMEQDYYESDGHYFIDDAIIFYSASKNEYLREFEILYIYQCAMVPQTDGQIRPQRYNHDHELKKDAESDGYDMLTSIKMALRGIPVESDWNYQMSSNEYIADEWMEYTDIEGMENSLSGDEFKSQWLTTLRKYTNDLETKYPDAYGTHDKPMPGYEAESFNY